MRWRTYVLPRPARVAADIDPAVERIIRRCLDPDPAKRPPGALAVAAALPGGDPLAAALAAGETPSPELVASAGKTEGMARKFSVPCLIAIILSLFAVPAIRQRYDAMMHAPLDYSPDMLALKSREVAAAFGYPKRPADSVISLDHSGDLLDHLNKLPEPRKWDTWFQSESPIISRYRESLSPLVARPTGDVTITNPPPISPGMVYVRLDGAARLREFSAVPYGTGGELETPVQPDVVFRAAGLDVSKFIETTPVVLPAGPADQVRAWNGPHPAIPNTELNVEIASWKGRITYAKVAFPWDKPQGAQSGGMKLSDVYGLAVITGSLFFAALFARRNWKLGRIDRKGALRIATASFFLDMAAWVGSVHAVPTDDMYDLLRRSMAEALFSAAIIWVVYLALEPAVRARWPHSIVTWNRIMAGRWLDPLVASHILIGAAAGCAIWIAMGVIPRLVGPPDTLGGSSNLYFAMGARQWFAGLSFVGGHTITIGLVGFFAIFGLRTLLRKDVLAALAASVMFTFLEGNVINSSRLAVVAPLYACLYAAMIFLLLRFGLVVTLAAVCFINGCGALVVGSDWKAWYAPSGVAMLLLMLAVAFVAFWRSLGAGGLLGEAPEGE